MPTHGLDHIVHAVRDLDAAAEFYARAGFTVGARNRHAWGTHNRIVQFFLKAFAGVEDLHFELDRRQGAHRERRYRDHAAACRPWRNPDIRDR